MRHFVQKYYTDCHHQKLLLGVMSVKLFFNLCNYSAYQQGAKRCRAQPATLRSYPIQDLVPERPEPSEARALSFSVLELRGLRCGKNTKVFTMMSSLPVML